MLDTGVKVEITENMANELTSKVITNIDRTSSPRKNETSPKEKSIDEKIAYYSDIAEDLLECSAIIPYNYSISDAKIIRKTARELCIDILRRKFMSPIPLTKQEKRTFSKYNKWSRLGAEAGISCILYGSGTKVNEDIENFVCNHFKGSSEDISDFMNFVAILSGIVKNHDFVSDIAFTKFC